MNKLKSHLNSFSGKITLVVMLGISLIAVTVSFVVLYMSRHVFSQNYGDSQEKVFEQIEKEILKTVQAKKPVVEVKKGKKAKVQFSSKLDMNNVAKITYKSEKKSVAKVDAKGNVIAKKKGTAVIKAVVTLKNGKKKTLKIKYKVK